MVKYLIFGRGQIGNFYNDYFNGKGVEAVLADTDITDLTEVKKIIQKQNPEIVINTAAKTNLEWVAKNKLEAIKVNVLGADNIASVCEDKGIYHIFLSSGCIFQSHSEKDIKKEDDKPEPGAFYSWTKVWAENLITARKNLKYLILRPRQPISAKVSEKNALIKMLTFSKFVREGGWNSATVLEDFMWITERLVEKRAVGIFNVTNDGYTTPYKIGLFLKKYINPSMEVEPITHDELDEVTPEKRVAVVVDNSKLKSLGINPEPIEKRLEEVVKELSANLKKVGSDKVLAKTEETTRERAVTSLGWKKIFT